MFEMLAYFTMVMQIFYMNDYQMIDLVTYRYRVGSFNSGKGGSRPFNVKKHISGPKSLPFSPELLSPTEFISLDLSNGDITTVRTSGSQQLLYSPMGFLIFISI